MSTSGPQWVYLSLQHSSATGRRSYYSQMETRGLKASAVLSRASYCSHSILLSPQSAEGCEQSCLRLMQYSAHELPQSPAFNINAPEQFLQLPVPSLSCSANPHPISTLITHLGQRQFHSLHPPIVRAVGNKQCVTRLVRVPHGGRAVFRSLSTLHPHTTDQVAQGLPQCRCLCAKPPAAPPAALKPQQSRPARG